MAILPETGPTPVAVTEYIHGGIPCEICGTVTPLASTHSFVLGYAMPGAGYSAFQCANEQHFGCSRDHAILAAVTCLFGHMLQNHPYAGSDQALSQEVTAIRSQITSYL